ncbi:MAG: PAS domain S-box protein [Cyanobacteriota bacterium]|nr:PAS domain S-box protein [Cyanobacteriota bacterium]
MAFLSADLPTLEDILDLCVPAVAPNTPILEVLSQMSGVSIPGTSQGATPTPAQDETPSDRPKSYTSIAQGTRLLGIFTERDVVRLMAQEANFAKMTVAQGMTEKPPTLKTSEYRDLFSVLSIFRKHRIRYLPILDDREQLIGVVSQNQLHDALHHWNFLRMYSVAEAMSDRVVRAFSTTPVRELARQMYDSRVSCIVITEEERPVGIVTERDLVRYQLLDLELDRLQAADVMSAPLHCLHVGDNLWVARQQMQRDRVRRSIVIGDRGELRGILTQSSVLGQLEPGQLYQTIETLEEQVKQLEEERIQVLQRRNAELKQANERLQAQIAERQQAAEALYQSEEKFRQLAEHIRDVFWISDPASHRLLYVSPAYEQVWGRSSQALEGKLSNLIETIDPEYRDAVCQTFEKLRQGESTDIEYRILRPDGELRWIHDRGFPIRDESGRVYRLVSLSEDITDRKQSELTLHDLAQELEHRVEERTTQLRQTNRQLEYEVRERQQIEVSLRFFEERFRRIFEQAAVGMSIGSADGRFIQINQKTCDILGYTEDELRMKTRLDTIDPHDRQVYLNSIEALFQGDIDTFSIELRLIHQQGHTVWVHTTVSILSTQEGHPRYDVAIFEDISDRKRMEEDLRTSQQKYQTLFETLPIGVGMTDESGKFIEANAALEKLLGVAIDGGSYSCDRPPWQPIRADGTPIPSQELASVTALTDNRIVKDREEGIANDKGEMTWLSVTAAPIPLRRYGVAIAYLDITERKQTERMKDEFIAIASHELRTPLTSLNASLILLSTGKLGDLGDRGKQLLEFAQLDTQRLVELVNDLLNLQRLRFDAQTLNFQPCPIERPMQQAASAIELLAKEAGISLSIHSIPATASIDCDSIVRVLTNLLVNAIKFSPRGETVWLNVDRQEDQLCLSVTDRGRGIPADKLDAIFEPFSQVDNSQTRANDGTGLGLAICRSIINRHGGRIWVESHPGEGSTFYFTVTVHPEENPVDLRT